MPKKTSDYELSVLDNAYNGTHDLWQRRTYCMDEGMAGLCFSMLHFLISATVLMPQGAQTDCTFPFNMSIGHFSRKIRLCETLASHGP